MLGNFLSQITPLSSLHYDHAFASLLATSLLAPPPLSIVDPKYLKDWTVGKLTISVSMYIIMLTGSVSPVVCKCCGFRSADFKPILFCTFSPSL